MIMFTEKKKCFGFHINFLLSAEYQHFAQYQQFSNNQIEIILENGKKGNEIGYNF